MDYCFTFLCAGERYNKALSKRLSDNSIFKNANLVVTTDDPSKFEGLGCTIFHSEFEKLSQEGQEEQRQRRTRKRGGDPKLWFNYNLKYKAIRNAAELGFSKIFYIDSDIKVDAWDEDFFIKEERGAFFRRTLKRRQHPRKYEFYDKIFRLDLWKNYRPVSEKIIYFNESVDKIKAFTETWEYLDIISRGHVTPPSEGHEIRISCKVNNIDVGMYKPDPFKKAGGKVMTDRDFCDVEPD